MTPGRSRQPWPTAVLVLLCLGAIVAAVLLVGPASGSQAPEGRVIAAAQGVVQSTVSGSGNVQPASELDLGFKTAGVVSQIYVHQGEYVTEGKLLAELDPKSAEAALQQARANLQQAQAGLLQAQEASSTSGAGAGTEGSSGTEPGGRGRAQSSSPTGASTTNTATVSPALHEADIASAEATVSSDALAVRSAEEALADTRLYAPQSGTIVSFSGEVGEAVAAAGTTRASGGNSGSGTGEGGSGSSGTGASSASALGGGRGSSSSTGTGSSSTASTPFAVLSDLSSMQLVVPLSESEVGSVRPGQPATVTVEALEGTKLAAHVVSVATLPTSNGGVVSYDVTFALDQLAGGLKPGMTATAEVVVKQAEGVNVPTSAIAGGTVTVVDNGRRTHRRVVTGLAGNSSTIVLSGLRAGEQVVLPLARAGAASLLGGRLGAALGGRLGAGALGGGALGGGGGIGGGGATGLRGGLRGG